jgi:lysophospholipase L1-like esterase
VTAGHLARVVAAGTLSGIGLLALQVVWVVRRDLPSLVGLDSSGAVGSPGCDPPIRIVALGDSSLTGPGLTHHADVWLQQALAKLEPTVPVELLSLAVGGSRVADVLARAGDAVATNADVAVVAVGSNDAIHGTPSRAFARDLDRLLTTLQASIPVVAVCNVGDLGNIARVPRPLNLLLRTRARIISNHIQIVVAAHPGVVLIDVTGADAGLRDRSVYADDLFHPNRSGHALWADAARPGLVAALTAAGAIKPNGATTEPRRGR